jgi:predicted nucleic-acid-binding Zn-ribbon protein
MESSKCPKCGHEMDEGHASSGGDYIGYVSQKQTGMLRTVTKIASARACSNCGYVEFYLDPGELKKRIA